jgi:hypothetical protein
MKKTTKKKNGAGKGKPRLTTERFVVIHTLKDGRGVIREVEARNMGKVLECPDCRVVGWLPPGVPYETWRAKARRQIARQERTIRA